ncbi:MAG: phosphoribosylglycinamide formyltransferase [Chitinophagales bacterium]|nr:phosphoribosylglycinamide formyltransferase [Chitinophagales bacterium]MDW8272733.1 phosphoribosylglycinamide formyltransferase [Chitinophagales bacterium]
MKNIAIFASGSGTNTEKIIRYFNDKEKAQAKVALVVCNNPMAGVLEKSNRLGVSTAIVTEDQLKQQNYMLELFHQHNIEFIVLAGFLKLIPGFMIYQYTERIVNIHPALLPKYGGKGMYGMRVHQAVWENKERQTGITIHYANEKYDEGDILFQATTQLTDEDTPNTIAQKVQQLEHRYYPWVLEALLQDL